jgi:exonuclease III
MAKKICDSCSQEFEDFGFYDCSKKFNTERVQTLRHKHSNFPWQNDYLFAGKKLYDACISSEVIDDTDLYEISDHNPIIAEFDLSLVKQ